MLFVYIFSCFILAATALAQPAFPPVRPNPTPPFHIPRGGEALDDGWQYMQTIADADTAYPNYLNTYPVEMAFTHQGRGFLATLHTVFHTPDGGRTWQNLDPLPPPSGGSAFNALRSPTYVTGMAPRPLARTSINYDSLYISSLNTSTNAGRVRLLSHFSNNYYLQLDTIHFYVGPHWLTGIAAPDSDNAFTFAGYDRLIYTRDSLSQPIITFWDSLYATPEDQWVAGPVARVNNLMMAVGSAHWISRDGGETWTTTPSADAQGDNGVSFADTLHGLTGGGRLNPSSGWVHVTTDGGVTWSGRVLETSYPIRCVEMVTPEIGFAAGGNYNTPAGEIWKTTDGGQTWNLDATMDAEITAIESERMSGAYVDVIAAGVYPDFRGGAWRSQLYLPDPSGAVLAIDPDTLDFGVVTRGDTGLVITTVRNDGGATAILYSLQSSHSAFAASDVISGVQIAPGGEIPLHLIFTPPDSDSVTEYSAVLTLLSADGRTEIIVMGAVPLSGDEQSVHLPQSASLTVWPNPGNAVFQIRFELARASAAAMSIFDLSGRVVKTLTQGNRNAGQHVVTWNAADAASGIYFVRLETTDARMTKKLLLVK